MDLINAGMLALAILTSGAGIVVAIRASAKSEAKMESRIEKVEDSAADAGAKALEATTEARAVAGRTARLDVAVAGIVPRLQNLETTCAEMRDDVKTLLRSRP